jgi:hypothetical protein
LPPGASRRSRARVRRQLRGASRLRSGPASPHCHRGQRQQPQPNGDILAVTGTAPDHLRRVRRQGRQGMEVTRGQGPRYEDAHRQLGRLRRPRPVLPDHRGGDRRAGRPGHFFDLLAEDAVFEFVITVPGYPRRVEGRAALAELYRPYGTAIRRGLRRTRLAIPLTWAGRASIVAPCATGPSATPPGANYAPG